jgi:hypothetical protein
VSWEKQLEDLKRLLPAELALAKIEREDIPAADRSVEETNAKLAPASTRAEEVTAAILSQATTPGHPIYSDSSVLAGLDALD